VLEISRSGGSLKSAGFNTGPHKNSETHLRDCRKRRNDNKKVPANFAWMRERAFCGMSSFMLLERFPEVQSLGPEDKWRLIDELWSDLAQQVEGEAPNETIVELLEKRFSDYLVDPSQGQPADDAFARLAEHKRQWK
jgi:putative addiction module component (TIGR02574 family)